MKRFLKTSQAGFTIIEVLIAITISAIIALILTQLLSGSLQSGNKSDLLNNIQHNGESALSRIDNDVRSAYNVTCVTPTALVVAEGNNYHRYWFAAAVVGASPKNASIREDQIASLNVTQSGDNSPCVTDTSAANYIPGDTAQYLTDADPDNGVSVTITSGIFSRGAANADGSLSQVVNISFSIGAPVNAPAGFASQVPTAIPFQTSVKVRCYKGDVSCE